VVCQRGFGTSKCVLSQLLFFFLLLLSCLVCLFVLFAVVLISHVFACALMLENKTNIDKFGNVLQTKLQQRNTHCNSQQTREADQRQFRKALRATSERTLGQEPHVCKIIVVTVLLFANALATRL
jgi:hypothetical protein